MESAEARLAFALSAFFDNLVASGTTAGTRVTPRRDRSWITKIHQNQRVAANRPTSPRTFHCGDRDRDQFRTSASGSCM